MCFPSAPVVPPRGGFKRHREVETVAAEIIASRGFCFCEVYDTQTILGIILISLATQEETGQRKNAEERKRGCGWWNELPRGYGGYAPWLEMIRPFKIVYYAPFFFFGLGKRWEKQGRHGASYKPKSALIYWHLGFLVSYSVIQPKLDATAMFKSVS